MRYLRQNTAAMVVFGPFVSPTDAVTQKTVLSSQTGRILKNGVGGAFTPASWAHDGQGYYLVGLGTGDTDTIGRLTVHFDDSATYLPVWEHFNVLSTAVFDWLFGTTAPNTSTPPTVVQVRQEMDVNSTRLANLDAAVSSRLAPTVAGRTLDVSAGGEAGLDWANVGAPTTVVSLSGTTVGTVTSLTNAATVNVINGLAPPTNWNLMSLDGAGRVLLQPAQAGVTIPTVTAVTNAVVLPSIPANWIAAGGVATGALNGKGDWLTTLGGTAPVGWINAAAFVSGAVDASAFAQTAADKVWGTASRTLTAFGFTVSVSPVTLAANQPNYAPAVAGDAMNLTTVERSAVGTAVWASGSRTLTDKTGFGMAPNGVDTVIIETGFNLRQAMSLVCAVNMGNISGQNTNHPIVRAMGNDAVRIDAQADADGNRSDIILTPPL